MKKIRLFTLLTLLVTLSLLLLVGCKNEDAISSIALKDHDPNIAIEIAVGEFDYGAYTLVATYKSGNAEEIALTKDMIADTDLVKLYQEGEHDITVTYGDQKCTFKVSVKRSAFKDLSFSENNVFTYNGKAHVVEVEGNIPANAVVTYLGGNSFVNAGNYDVTAIVSCEGYVTEKLTATVQIQQAKYDVSGVKFQSQNVVYDGQLHMLTIEGDLPEGVATPTYYLDSNIWAGAKNAGVYKVRAVFTHSNPNYEPIPSMEATLTIEKAKHDVGDLKFEFKDPTGKTMSMSEKVYDGMPMSVSLSADTWLPKGTGVSYSARKDGEELSNVNPKGPVLLIEAGTYTVTASFTLSDEDNYESIAEISTTVVIHKATYVLGDDVYMESEVFIYDGSARSLKIKGLVPEYLEISYEYYLNDVLQVDKKGDPIKEVKNAGKYTVKAIFTHSNKNYANAEPISADLHIIEAELDMSGVAFSAETSFVYDGADRALTLVGLETLPDFVKVSYQYYQRVPCVHKETDSSGAELYKHMFDETVVVDENGAEVTSVRDAGEYAVKVVFTVENPNYADIGSFSAPLTIQKATVDLGDLEMVGESSYTYDGQRHGWELQSISNLVRVEKNLYFVNASGSRTRVTSAVNCGNYVSVFEFSLVDEKNYLFEEDFVTTQEEMFSIVVCEIDVSGIALTESSSVYNGTDQYPTLTGVHAYLEATVTVYPQSGTAPVTQVVNAGAYRVEIVIVAKNNNYRPSVYRLERSLEIRPREINVSDWTFDQTKFTYDGNAHLPAFEDLDPSVMNLTNVNLRMHISHAIEEDWPRVNDAISAGTYRYEFTLALKDSNNYVLCGRTNYSYSIDFTIESQKINIDPLLSGENELNLISGGYTQATIAEALGNALFKDMSEYVTCSLGGDIYSIGGQKIDANQMVVGEKYKITLHLVCDGDRVGSYEICNYALGYTHSSGDQLFVIETTQTFVVVIV